MANDPLLQKKVNELLEWKRKSTASIAHAGVTLIQTQTLTGTSATIMFQSIPQIYSTLELILYARGDTAATSVVGNMTFNNDTGANYDYKRLNVGAAAALTQATANGAASAQACLFAAATALADVFDSWRILIPAYAGTTGHKTFRADGTWINANTDAGLNWHSSIGKWRSAAAISEIDITASAGNFIAGSMFSLYGWD